MNFKIGSSIAQSRVRRLSGWMAIALLAALAVSTTEARAAVVSMTYDGVIRTGFGRTSVFGAPPADLVGSAYRAVYLFDTEVGRKMGDATFQSVAGGTVIDEPSPWLGASLTINGVTIQLLGDRRSVASTANGRNFTGVSSTVVHNLDPEGFVVRSEMDHNISTRAVGATIGARLDQPFVYEVAPGDVIQRAYYEGRDPIDFQRQCCTTQFNFTPQRVTVALAVPEPATWAMMVMGFGLLGTALRRRQYASAVPSLRISVAAS